MPPQNEDAQIAVAKSLQSIFLEADDNGDGILQLDEFSAMIQQRKPEVTEGEAFKVYDEALALSESMLGYETDAILADAFVKVALSHNLFPDVAQKLTSADDSHHEPPHKWGAVLGTDGTAGGPPGPAINIAAMLRGSTGTLMAASASSPALNGSPKLGGSRGSSPAGSSLSASSASRRAAARAASPLAPVVASAARLETPSGNASRLPSVKESANGNAKRWEPRSLQQ